jgi:hypothetical protein
MIEYGLGEGVISTRNGKNYYKGTLPFKKGEQVVVFKQDNLDRIIRGEMSSIFTNPIPMSLDFFDRSEGRPRIIDHLGSPYGEDLLLERNFYLLNEGKIVVLRYMSIEKHLEEERMRA